MLELNFTPFPNLQSARVVLREMTNADIEDLFVLRSNKDIMQYIDRPIAQNPLDAEKLIAVITENIANQGGITWGISLQNSPRLIGTIGFWRIEKEHYRTEIGYLLHPDFQGQGIMHEAMLLAIGYAFDVMKVHSIEANVNPENNASIRLLERYRFIKEGHFKENYFFEGKFKDSAIYSLLTSSHKTD